MLCTAIASSSAAAAAAAAAVEEASTAGWYQSFKPTTTECYCTNDSKQNFKFIFHLLM